MLSITDLKKDTLIQIDGTPYRVTEYGQKQMGRGGSIVNVKLKNLIDGSVIPKTYKGQDKIEPADVESRKLQYLYSDGTDFHFMNEETFDQYQVAADTVGDQSAFMKEGTHANLQFFDGRVINVELPIKVPLEVTEAPEVVKGDTQSTVQKECELETGATVMCPIFVKTGDVVIIDTRDGSYVERQK